MEPNKKHSLPPVVCDGPEQERLMTNRELIETYGADTLIECQSCYRTFHTQAQFGQHSRICRGGSATSRRFIDCKTQPFKYCYLERQSKDKLEIKSRFVVELTSISVVWKDVVKQNALHDSGIAEDLKAHRLGHVHTAIRHSQRSGLIVANFVIRSVEQTSSSIYIAKMDIERAVDRVKAKLPSECTMRMHLCSIENCRELVIRDTEGYCSRHRAQKYHKRNAQKRSLLQQQQRREQLQAQSRAQSLIAPQIHNIDSMGLFSNLSNLSNVSQLSGQQRVLQGIQPLPDVNALFGSNSMNDNLVGIPPPLKRIKLDLESLPQQNVNNLSSNQIMDMINNFNPSNGLRGNQFDLNQLNLLQNTPIVGSLGSQQQQLNQGLGGLNGIQSMHSPQLGQRLFFNTSALSSNGSNTDSLVHNTHIGNNISQANQLPVALLSDSPTNSTVSGADRVAFPLNQQVSMDPLMQAQLQRFLSSNLYVLNTPSQLSGVPIMQTSLRKDGMNIISVDYATQIPNPRHVLQKDGQLILFGRKEAAQNLPDVAPSNSIRFPQFCQDLTHNYIACVPTPECLVGSTLAATPQLSNNGIHMMAVNLQTQHPQKMCNTPLKESDLLLFQFNRAHDKGGQIFNAFEQIRGAAAASNNGDTNEDQARGNGN